MKTQIDIGSHKDTKDMTRPRAAGNIFKTMKSFALVMTAMKCPWPLCSSFLRGE